MTGKKRTQTDTAAKARRRYVDQPNQWIDTTPTSVKKKNAKAWKDLESSLTPAQRKKIGINSKKKK